MRLELHNPPMVSIERVPLKRRTTTYVRTQSKLLEIEYNINSNIKDNTLVNLENPNENDPESNVELPKVEEHSKEESKRSDISNSHLFKNPEVNDENSIKIEEKQEN